MIRGPNRARLKTNSHLQFGPDQMSRRPSRLVSRYSRPLKNEELRLISARRYHHGLGEQLADDGARTIEALLSQGDDFPPTDAWSGARPPPRALIALQSLPQWRDTARGP